MKFLCERKTAMTITLLSIFLLTLSAIPSLAYWQRASPHETVETTLNGKKISITYGRPYLKGRHLGSPEFVTYDKVWRTGADEATTLVTEVDLKIGAFSLPKGTYTLFTLPSASGWKLIINKRTGQWGIPYTDNDIKQELVRLDMKVEKLPSPVEQFTISFAKSGTGGVLKMEWENTRASIPFSEKK